MLSGFLIFLPLLLLICAGAFRYWQTAVIWVLVWAMIEGAVRKWLFPGFQAQILQLKDIALVFIYLGYFVSGAGRRATYKNGIIASLIVLEIVYCTVELLNPNSPSFIVSVYGLKGYIIYLPLIFVLPAVVTDRAKLKRLMIQTCIIAIPIGLLGLYQFSQPPSSWVNQYVSHEEGAEAIVSVFGAQEEGEFQYGRARTSSTFSYIGGFTTFVLLTAPLAFVLLLSTALPKKRNIIIYAALLCSIGGSVTTGSRTPIVIFALMAPLLILIAGWKGLLPIQSAFKFAVGIALISVVTVSVFGSAISALQYRAENSDSNLVRFASPVLETIDAFEASPLIGTGIGSNSNAAVTVLGGEWYWWLNGNLFELEPARIMQELGVFGCVVVYLLKIFVTLAVFQFLKESKSRLFVSTYMVTLAFLIPHFVLYTVNNPNGGLMYWALAGLAIGTRQIEIAETHAVAEQSNYVEQGFPVRSFSFQ